LHSANYRKTRKLGLAGIEATAGSDTRYAGLGAQQAEDPALRG
jgi:hypothetical protein